MSRAVTSDAQPVQIDRLPQVGPAAVCMGVFDGVHRGHLALVRATAAAARQRGATSVALVFEPHPDEVVRPGTRVPRLAPLAENLRVLAMAGIDRPIAVRFDPGLRGRTPEEFIAAMQPSIDLRALVMTPEAAFGRNRAGTPEAMREHGARTGYDLVLADLVAEGGMPISSARIRERLALGDTGAARRMLGHAPYLEAVVPDAADGDGRHPLEFDYAPALPAAGHYPARWQQGADRGRWHSTILQIDGDGGAAIEMAGSPGGRIRIEVGAR